MRGHVHFRHQRLSAYALIILLPALMLGGPLALFLQALTFIVALYHGLLGLTMVIEDYVRCGRLFLIFLVRVISMGLMAVVVWHAIKMM